MTPRSKPPRRPEFFHRSVDEIKLDPKNARKHPPRQQTQLRASIREFGFTVPILTDDHGKIIAGHARFEAAKAEGLTELPCVAVSHLSRKQKRALAIADNRIAEQAIWDEELLREQLAELLNADFNVELTGFSTAEIDVLFETPAITTVAGDPDDVLPDVDPAEPAVSRLGDVWQLGEHVLLCADSLCEESFQQLLGDQRAQLVIADSPFNVPVTGHVSGLGRNQHREFAMASGEMSRPEFTQFLTTSFKLCARFSVDGSIHYQFMDWRHMREMLDAGEQAYTEFKGLCVWSKTNAGMGSLYRSRHELIFVWKSGKAPHINNVELGRHGRYRTNVWDYAGVNTFRRGRDQELAMHPTVKPVGLVADAIRDCSKVGGLVLDPFAGSGTTIIAAERTKRRAAAIEIEPLYVDVAVRRWQERTGKKAILAATEHSFAEVAAERLPELIDASCGERDDD